MIPNLMLGQLTIPWLCSGLKHFFVNLILTSYRGSRESHSNAVSIATGYKWTTEGSGFDPIGTRIFTSSYGSDWLWGPMGTGALSRG
jgi:hypothetical protein